ncbi:MAG: NADP-dependent oxidoreductase, partial [Betaproteobacteria bacterium]|nr:NADP-dependent oxidoreductase [Betaproteobacteria bacterium]
MSDENLRVLLAERPEGWVEPRHLRIERAPLPVPGDGEVLVRNLWLSLDPYMRGRMSDAKSYAEPVALGAVMVGGTAGEVVESRDPSLRPGDKVVGMLG